MIFSVVCGFSRPGLHIWRSGANVRRHLRPLDEQADADGWHHFECELDPCLEQEVGFKLYQRAESSDAPEDWEDAAFDRLLPRSGDGGFPDQVWCAQGSARVLVDDPRAASQDRVRIQLITARRYREGQLFLWRPDEDGGERLDPDGVDSIGPFWDLELSGRRRQLVNFKFLRQVDGKDRFEPDYANRILGGSDGPQVWTHSEGLAVVSRKPVPQDLVVNFRQEGNSGQPPRMHLWQEASDFSIDVDGEAAGGGWRRFRFPLYPGLPYRLLFHDPGLPEDRRWEHRAAARSLVLDGPLEVWALEGAPQLLSDEPKPEREVSIQLGQRPPDTGLSSPLFAHVWVDRARFPLHARLAPDPSEPGLYRFNTYAGVTSSFKFTDGVRWEPVARHRLWVPDDAAPLVRHAVFGRSDLLQAPNPLPELFRDPPFPIRRPGVWEEGGQLRFALHAPEAARARLSADWTGWEQRPLELHLTRGGSYWWGAQDLTELTAALPPGAGGDYHGSRYQFLLNDGEPVQDPAAGWVDSTNAAGKSRLVRQDAFEWDDADWRIPDWDRLLIYQLHPKRFSDRFPDDPPLVAVAREIEESHGYLHNLGVTAILLMPVNEVSSDNSWGYDPTYFYAVERDYGGPDALKRLVDACHRQGLAVLIDLVFNHAGSDGNILWRVAKDSYFDGDTRWGAMIDFDQPQCRHFFEQNLVYWQREFHIDGFRLDHTHTIVHSHQAGGFVREAGSGGGWAFLHGLRRALHRDADARALLSAEHLPNEWGLTNYGGPMDSQWCDDFHDRLVDACRGRLVMPRLAEALRLSHDRCQQWYNVTNYSESHDEVGNVNDRIANVAGYGRGLRMSKVAAAASLLGRGIPMFFMGAEAGEHRQFRFGATEVLGLDEYRRNPALQRVRDWWKRLCRLRASNALKGPAKLEVRYTDAQILAFSRGLGDDYFVVLNFGGWSGWKSLAEMNLPDRMYRELWNSTWPAFAVEGEGEHGNGGRDARLLRGHWLQIPDFGVVVLERV